MFVDPNKLNSYRKVLGSIEDNNDIQATWTYLDL